MKTLAPMFKKKAKEFNHESSEKKSAGRFRIFFNQTLFRQIDEP
jgi:hypothetical protein